MDKPLINAAFIDGNNLYQAGFDLAGNLTLASSEYI